MRTALLCIPVLFVSCASPRSLDRLTQLQLAADKIKIDLSDGVSDVEAYKIASSALRISEGYAGIPRDEGKEWRVEIFEGYAGIHTKDVFVDKESGVAKTVAVK